MSSLASSAEPSGTRPYTRTVTIPWASPGGWLTLAVTLAILLSTFVGRGGVRLGERSVIPGTAGLSTDAVRNELPTPLIIVLALLGAAALATLSPFVRRHVIARFKR